MLCLKGITKEYVTGDTKVEALKGIDISFRNSEFVAILGPSGCGKTTLLNIIGGLDQYTDGDLIIKGRSTKQYKDGDWDAYRNHCIGFVFQNYNLIPHQTVLANVELALTLSGIGKAERRRRAVEVLNKVGLDDQLNKKPNQMSGGQMQRVAIARALINDPEILLADEPTGALDSATSIQIMELLKEIASDRLVIMVTHNPDLAEQYATRTVKLLDGKIIDDSAPCAEDYKEPEKQTKKHTSMSFLTALGLSINNLLTKKTRTFITAFAGSIGIIGIALILSVSNGVQFYIDRVQEDTLSSYPITIKAEQLDMSGLVKTLVDMQEDNDNGVYEDGKVYTSAVSYNLMNSFNTLDTKTNNLGVFSEYLENETDIADYASSIQYGYNTDLNIYVQNYAGEIIKSDVMDMFMGLAEASGTNMSGMMGGGGYNTSLLQTNNTMEIWEEILPGSDGDLISPLLYEQYDLVYGSWPKSYDEVVLVINENNKLTDFTLYALGLRTIDEFMGYMTQAYLGEQIDIDSMRSVFEYDELCGITFKYLFPADCYQQQADGTYIDLAQTQTGLEMLYNSDKAVTLKISGIIRANSDAVSSMLSGAIGYTKALTDYILDRAENNELILAQKNDPETDVFSGLPFENKNAVLTDAEKAAAFREYAAKLSDEEKAQIYKSIAVVPTEEYVNSAVNAFLAANDVEKMKTTMVDAYCAQTGMDASVVQGYLKSMDDETILTFAKEAIRQNIIDEYAARQEKKLNGMNTAYLAKSFDKMKLTDEMCIGYYDTYMPDEVSSSTYKENMNALGYVSISEPSTVNIYASTFADKDHIDQIIADYNEQASEENRITYTDYISLILSSVSTIINAISYVLIAFVAISLIVSSIMIGILRAIGASKKDIRRVFDAETVTIGFASGVIGIGVTLLLLIPINIILVRLTGIAILTAKLPAVGAVLLVIISTLLTFIAGLVPSGIAAKKDPVIALRSE